MNRRRFNLLVAAGLMSNPRRLLASVEPEAIDGPALIELPAAPPTETVLEHWRAARNSTWRWFEQSRLINGEWQIVAATAPVHRETGERKEGVDGYADDSLVPRPLFEAAPDEMTDFCVALEGAAAGPTPTAGRRARDGRPPSHWLRGLDRDELRWWLANVEPPEAGVAGMTFLEHLTEGHGFELARVEGLTLTEQAKLHGAAHGGY
ncbi:MAG: hypothetical protein AAGG46_06605 [Planctomycetota bacterium]